MHEPQDIGNTVRALRERVALVCRVLGGLDLMKAATGHASARLAGTDRVFVRGRGDEETGLRFTTPEQIVEVDLTGRLVESLTFGVEAPREVFIHTSVYRNRPDVFGVVHGHPLAVVLMSMSGKSLMPLYGAFDPPSARLAIQGVPLYSRTYLCDTPVRGDELAQALGNSYCCVMRGHGSTTCGPNVEEAALTTIHLNDLADINYKAAMIGSCDSIPEDERDWIVSGERFSASTQNGARPQGRAGSLWRYYSSIVGEVGS